jgi:DNA repair protein RadA/Sms
VAKWVGRCPECQAWGTVEEIAAARPALARVGVAGLPRAPALPIAQVDIEVVRARPTGVGELDRVLGGGIVPGAVVLLAGEPGVGK